MRWLLLFVTSLATLFLLILLGEPSLGLQFIGAVVLVAAFVLGSQALKVTRVDLLSPTIIYPLVTLVYFGVGAPNLVHNFVISWEVPSKVWWPIGTALIAFAAGAKMAKTRSRHFLPRNVKWSPIIARRSAISLFIVSAGLTIFGFVVAGSPLVAGPGGEELRFSYAEKVGGWISIAHVGLETSAFIAAFLLVLEHRNHVRLDRWLVVIFLSAFLLLTLTGVRTYLVFLLFGCTAICHYYYRSIRLSHAVLGGAALIAILGAIGFFRVWFLQEGSDWFVQDLARMGINPLVAPFAPMYLSFRSGAENLAYLYDAIPAEFPYFHGGLFWRTFSVLWVRHQQLSASYLGEHVFGKDPSIFGPVGATTVGTFWAEDGYVGIIIGFCLVGYILEAFYQRMKNVDSLFWRLCYVSTLGTFLIYVYGTFFGEINLLLRLFFLGVVGFVSATCGRQDAFSNHRELQHL